MCRHNSIRVVDTGRLNFTVGLHKEVHPSGPDFAVPQGNACQVAAVAPWVAPPAGPDQRRWRDRLQPSPLGQRLPNPQSGGDGATAGATLVARA